MTRSLRITMMAILVPVTTLSTLILGREIGRLCLRGHPFGILGVAIAFTVAVEAVFASLLFRYLLRTTYPLESRLRSLEQTGSRISDIVESAQDLILSFDDQGRIFYMNRAGLRMLDIPALDEPYRELRRYFSADDGDALNEGVRIAAERGHWTRAMTLSTSGGRTFPASITMVSHGTEGPEIYYSAIGRDISEQALIEESLRRSMEQADRIHREKSQFLAWAGHEIRTPLHAAIGLLRLIDRGEMSPLHREYVDQVEMTSRQLLQTLNAMLDLSRLEADIPTVETQSFPFDEWMLKLERTMRLLLGTKPLDLRIRIDPGIPELLVGDACLLEQAITNLVGNAVKFTSRGMIELTISLEEDTGDRSVLSFEVRDTGIGMTEEQLRWLYKPYWQADPAIAREFGGTGLGLVITKKIVERIGGTLTESSMPGVGTTFRITMPFARDEAATELPPLPCSVLYIHHEESVRAQMVTLLSSFCEASCATGWEDVFATPGKESVCDWILVDLDARDARGIDAWQRWKRAADDRGISLVAYANMHDRQRLYRLADPLQPDAILLKPAGKLSLYREFLKRKPPHRHLPDCLPDAVPPADSDAIALVGNVLLVEDHEINRMVARRMLENLGCKVDVAASGTIALRRLANESYDLILMDLHMPDFDGVATAQEIRRNPALEAIPIVVLTADTTLLQHRRCYDAGIQEVCLKPYEPSRLRCILHRWLPAGGQADQPTKQEEAGAWPPELPGMHASQAIARLEGNVVFYARMLDKFRTRHRDVARELADELAREDWPSARRRLHSLRGAASHLSLYGVYEAATALEMLLAGENPEPPSPSPEKQLSQLSNQLETAFRSIANFEESVRFFHHS
ncbi:response regulator [Cohnella sp. REN36]|uniref:response regulator n=1 Tax=Cohnella sp. REN36 TaxID=2887347 RepID=UPI001D148288|nr:response regulator [Cohnella sp. REN36]MCC3373095.1 response regulator [Cohnella sp. REN36]